MKFAQVRSFHSLKAQGGYRLFGFFLFPSFPLIEKRWLDLLLIILAIVIYIGYYIQFIRLKKVHDRQREFSHSLIDLQEKERKRIAAELHDSIAQSILIIKNSALIGLRSKKHPSKMVKQLTEISEYASQTLQEIRKVTQNLRPVLLDRLGLTESLRHLAGTISSASSIEISTSIDQVDNLLNKEAEINLFRIVQESLNNIVKHSQATQAEISVKKDPKNIRIFIKDNGKGLNAQHTETRSDGGIGLVVMAERIKMLDGTWQISSFTGNGTTIQVEIPCNHL
jgi:two-component system, sensor histidine kinase LadS